MKSKPKDIIANLVNSIGHMDSGEESDTDDEMLHSSAYMVKSTSEYTSSEDIDVKAHFEYRDNPNFKDAIYAISDGGADSCILGMNAKVLSYTGRFANLVGYDPNTTRKEKVPIVTALIKVKSSSNEHFPILLKVHEAPYNPLSPITLLSEYQIREYGLVIDSVAKKH